MNMDFLKIQDDLLIIFASIIVFLLAGIIFLSIRSLFFHQAIEKILSRKLKSRDYNDVINRAKEFIDNKKSKRKDDSLFIMYYLAQAYEAQDSLTNALKFYQEAAVLSTKSKKLYSSILLHIAKIYGKLGKSKDALAYYLMLLEKDEGNVEALYDLALFQYKNKSFKKAREYLEKVLKRRSGLLDARFLYGKLLFDSGSYQNAMKQFRLLEKYDPENYEIFYYKARCLENLKKYNEAIKQYQFVLENDWKNSKFNSESSTLQKICEDCQISIINLFIKVKDYHSGIHYVSEYLSLVSSEETKTELIYLYANLLWNTGEEYQALKNFERIYMMNANFKDASIMYERYKKILPHSYLIHYFTSNEDNETKNFDSVCRKILSKHVFRLMYKHNDYYIYSKGVFYVVFYRHIEPIPFSKLTDIEILLNSFGVRPQNTEIYSLSGVREDAVTHYLIKNSRLIEGDEFMRTIKKIYQR